MNDLLAPIIPDACDGCSPWVRRIRNPSTGIPIEQTLHEETCTRFPKQQRKA